ncbi:hypothetical protein AA313_de0207276 [Arthrobotrys entomopaga]|nr:hypothetical protein AA313_de0207276 [Arthrobotrys entomopaga]
MRGVSKFRCLLPFACRPFAYSSQLHRRRIHISSASDPQSHDTPQPSSSAIHPAILERSPHRQRLSRLLKSLAQKTHYNGCTTYFPALRIEQALCDLASEDPSFKVAS